jgi:hypothetical protein
MENQAREIFFGNDNYRHNKCLSFPLILLTGMCVISLCAIITNTQTITIGLVEPKMNCCFFEQCRNDQMMIQNFEEINKEKITLRMILKAVLPDLIYFLIKIIIVLIILIFFSLYLEKSEIKLYLKTLI